MKLSEHKIDVQKQEDGAWVGEKHGTPIPEMGDLCLKVRGSQNKAWNKLYGKLLDAVPRNKKIGRLDQDESDRIMAIVLRETVLDDWENVEGDGVIAENGTPVPYDKKIAARLLTEPPYREFRDAVIWAASIVAKQTAVEIEEDAKN